MKAKLLDLQVPVIKEEIITKINYQPKVFDKLKPFMLAHVKKNHVEGKHHVRKRGLKQENKLLNNKSVNPSKRHRDRLNKELDNLAKLLPFSDDIIGRLDKLSILRLSVSFLRNKKFFLAEKIVSTSAENDVHVSNLIHRGLNAFILVISFDGEIFYVSEGVKDEIGYSQSQLLHQRIETILHEEDKDKIDVHVKGLLHNEADFKKSNDASYEDRIGQQKDFVVRLKCVLDGSAVDVYKPFHLSGTIRRLMMGSKNSPSSYALFSICTPTSTSTSMLEIRMKSMLFCSKNRLDLSFLDLDPRGREIFGYSKKEIFGQSSYILVHRADIQHLRCKHTEIASYGYSSFGTFRLMSKSRKWIWLSGYAKVHYFNGKPDFIVTTNRIMSDEEGLAMLNIRDDVDCNSLQHIGLTEPDDYEKALELGFPNRIVSRLLSSSSNSQNDSLPMPLSSHIPDQEKSPKDFSSCRHDYLKYNAKSDYEEAINTQRPQQEPTIEFCSPSSNLFYDLSNFEFQPEHLDQSGNRTSHIQEVFVQRSPSFEQNIEYSQNNSSNFMPSEYEQLPPNVSITMPQYDLSSILRSQIDIGHNFSPQHQRLSQNFFCHP